MGRVKDVLMSKQYDDFGPDQRPDWHLPVDDNGQPVDPRDSLTRADWVEIETMHFTDDELKAELKRRAKERRDHEKPSNTGKWHAD